MAAIFSHYITIIIFRGEKGVPATKPPATGRTPLLAEMAVSGRRFVIFFWLLDPALYYIMLIMP